MSALAVPPMLAVVAFAYAKEHDELGPYKLLATISIPGFGNGFESAESIRGGCYYLANRNAAVPTVAAHIDVIDTRRLKLLDPLPVHAAGNGVVAIRTRHDEGEWRGEGSNELWVGDAKSFVEVIDLESQSIVADIFTGGKGRADELAYDPRDHIILVANDQDTPPFATFISTKTRMVLGKLDYPQAVFGTPPTNHGLEQPVWNSKTRKFYLSVPGTMTNPQGEVDEIDPHLMAVTHVFPAVCNPGEAPQGVHASGWSRARGHHPRDGKVLKTADVSIDLVQSGAMSAYLPVDSRTAVDPSAVSFRQRRTHWSSSSRRSAGAHASVAADSETNRIFVPISGVGVKVYTDSDEEDGHRDD
jgi:hypothetical protein